MKNILDAASKYFTDVVSACFKVKRMLDKRANPPKEAYAKILTTREVAKNALKLLPEIKAASPDVIKITECCQVLQTDAGYAVPPSFQAKTSPIMHQSDQEW